MKENFKHKVAQKMMGKAKSYISKAYSTTRCGQCGKFGHHHETHKGETMKDMGGNNGRLATAKDRQKDPYLSADSRVWNKFKGK